MPSYADPLVEDEVKLAALIRRGLREEGLLADVAIKGEDALWIIAGTEYDVIVLDGCRQASIRCRPPSGCETSRSTPRS